MVANVVIGNKLVHGVTFEVNGKDVTVNGQNSNGLIALTGYTGVCGLTHMAEDVWEAIKAKYSGMTAIKKGFIFAQKNEASAVAAGEEIKTLATGAEQHALKESEKDK